MLISEKAAMALSSHEISSRRGRWMPKIGLHHFAAIAREPRAARHASSSLLLEKLARLACLISGADEVGACISSNRRRASKDAAR